jgi:uncharacterized protein CbrC (UPF0167 family)
VAEEFPVFTYHPDPMGTGSVERSDLECPACGDSRGFTYVGPVYAEDDVDGLCPWCIANGSAARMFDAEFTDVGFGVPDDVDDDALNELSQRTPGFIGWQQEHWLYHCGNPAAFLGAVGFAEVAALPDALDMLMREHDDAGWSEEDSEDFVRQLHVDGDATAYLFRCLSCAAHLAYSDTA